MMHTGLSLFRRGIHGYVVLVSATLVGCDTGVPVGQVTGVVTYAGQPLPQAEVEFTPKGDGTSSVGFTNHEGRYELQYTLHRKGALLGSHVVRVQSLSRNENDQARIRVASRTAGIECEVASGSNEINIELPAVEPSQLRPQRQR
jgi:hypothetical protein